MTENNLNNTAVSQIPTWFERKFDFTFPIEHYLVLSVRLRRGAQAYHTNMSDFAAMNGIYAKYFSQPFPVRTTIGAAALPLGACVEIDLVVKA